MSNVVTQKGEPLFFIHASGSDYEIGLAKGRAMAGDIAAAWEFFEPRFESMYGVPAEKRSQTYDWLLQNLQKCAPWMAEQSRGMADGSGFPAELLFLINHYALLWAANGLLCTSIALNSPEEGSLLGQNLDIGSEDLYFVEELHPQTGYATLSDGMVGMTWSPTGINERGLAVGSSNLSAPARAGIKPVPHGTPYTFLPRIVLRECANVSEAIERLEELSPVIPSGGGYQLNLIDRFGSMAVVDKVGDRTVVRQCEDGMNFTTNCSLDVDLERWRLGGNSNPRSYTARIENIRERYHGVNGRLSVDWLKDTLQSHNGEGRICRHGTADTGGGGYSRLSLVYHVCTGLMEITNGFPCVNRYQSFHLRLT